MPCTENFAAGHMSVSKQRVWSSILLFHGFLDLYHHYSQDVILSVQGIKRFLRSSTSLLLSNSSSLHDTILYEKCDVRKVQSQSYSHHNFNHFQIKLWLCLYNLWFIKVFVIIWDLTINTQHPAVCLFL